MSRKGVRKANIVIIGGGIIGSAAAYFLANRGIGTEVIVIEPDPTYARAATPAAAGGNSPPDVET